MMHSIYKSMQVKRMNTTARYKSEANLKEDIIFLGSPDKNGHKLHNVAFGKPQLAKNLADSSHKIANYFDSS